MLTVPRAGEMGTNRTLCKTLDENPRRLDRSARVAWVIGRSGPQSAARSIRSFSVPAEIIRCTMSSGHRKKKPRNPNRNPFEGYSKDFFDQSYVEFLPNSGDVHFPPSTEDLIVVQSGGTSARAPPGPGRERRQGRYRNRPIRQISLPRIAPLQWEARSGLWLARTHPSRSQAQPSERCLSNEASRRESCANPAPNYRKD